MATLGVITNPKSRRNRRDPTLIDQTREILGSHGFLSAPVDLQDLDRVLTDWQAQGITRVLVNGGDGTLHKVVTSLMRVWGEDLPQLGILPGGTMNIIANSIGERGRPLEVLRRLIALDDDCPLKQVWTLEISGGTTPQYGFLFGNGIIARFLEVYYEGATPTPSKAARILATGALSALWGGRAIRRLTQPFEGQLIVDGQPWPGARWTAIAAGTVEQIGLGFRAFHHVSDHPGQLHALGIGGSVLSLALELPRIYLGRPLAGRLNRDVTAHTLEIQGDGVLGFMIDGDFHTADGAIRVAVGPAVQFAVSRG